MKSPDAGHSGLADACRPPRPSAARKTRLKVVGWECLIVAVLGIVLALAANGISPRGLRLTTDYFPRSIQNAAPAIAGATQSPVADATAVALTPAEEVLAARLQAKGLRLVTSDQALRLFRDPRREQELIVFIDARNDWNYQQGHIPGALQFDHYRAADYLAAVLPVCQTADQIVVYCTGGDCEDSEFAAIFLNQAGVPAEKLLVYAGGMAEWTTRGLPVEIGARHSGNVHPAHP